MDIILLKTFLEVLGTRHFGKAASNLKISQAAVSLRIKQLENLVGSPIFNRYRNNLQLTDSGEKLYSCVIEIMKTWDRTLADISQEQMHQKVVRFGALNGFCGLLLKDSISSIYEEMVNIVLKVESFDDEVLRVHLMERKLDMALLYEASSHVDFVSQIISSVELVLVSTRQYSGIDHLKEDKYVEVDWGSFYNFRLNKLETKMPDPILKASQATFALQFLLDFSGSAFLPYRLVEKYLDKSLFLVEGVDVIHQPIHAIYHRNSPIVEELRTVTEILKKNSEPYFIQDQEDQNEINLPVTIPQEIKTASII